MIKSLGNRLSSFAKLFVVGLLLLSFLSCQTSSKGNAFYTNRGEWDDYEIPLIEPYQMVRLNGSNNWTMNLETQSMLDSITEINVVNGMILSHTMKTIYKGQIPGREVWAIVIPSKRIEEEFLTRADYINYLRKVGLKREPSLYKVELVAKYAGTTDIIDWAKIK